MNYQEKDDHVFHPTFLHWKADETEQKIELQSSRQMEPGVEGAGCRLERQSKVPAPPSGCLPSERRTPPALGASAASGGGVFLMCPQPPKGDMEVDPWNWP